MPWLTSALLQSEAAQGRLEPSLRKMKDDPCSGSSTPILLNLSLSLLYLGVRATLGSSEEGEKGKI